MKLTETSFLRPAWMEVDLDRLACNVKEIRRIIGTHRKLIAVAKADAFGHGVGAVAPILFDAGADTVAIGDLSDAVRLREAGCDKPLLLFGTYIPSDIVETVIQYQITPTVWDIKGASAFSKSARSPLGVFLKVDTGLHRLGISPEDAGKLATGISELPNLHIACVYTHFGDPIKEEEFTQEQFRLFLRALESIRAAGVHVPYACVASSAVVSMRPEMYMNAVDPGRILYGFYHPPSPPIAINLVRVARAAKSRLIHMNWVSVGDRIGGYEQAFYPTRRTLVGALPFGAWDGLIKTGVHRSSVLVRGRRCRIIGIHLEHCLLDLTEVEGVEIGDEAVFFGQQGSDEITLREQAVWAGVTETEVIISLGKTVRRIYFKDGKIC